VVAAAGGSAKHYSRSLDTIDARRSGCGVFDGAGAPHQLSKLHFSATSRSKEGD
jgi:hypothetical protein